MFIVTPTFHPLGRFLFSSWPSFGRFSVSSWPPKWAGSRSPRGLNLKLGRFSFSSWLQSQIGQVLVLIMAQSQIGQVLSSYLFSQTQSASRFNPLGRSSSWSIVALIGQVLVLIMALISNWAGSRSQLLVLSDSICKQVRSVRQVVIMARFGQVFIILRYS